MSLINKSAEHPEERIPLYKQNEEVYCLGKNTGCNHEDKPTLEECSDCPYMTTIKQDDLLLTPTEIRDIPFYKLTPEDALPYALLNKQVAKVQPIIIALREIIAYLEAKKLDRPELRKGIIRVLRRGARGLIKDALPIDKMADELLSLYPAPLGRPELEGEADRILTDICNGVWHSARCRELITDSERAEYRKQVLALFPDIALNDGLWCGALQEAGLDIRHPSEIKVAVLDKIEEAKREMKRQFGEWLLDEYDAAENKGEAFKNVITTLQKEKK